MIKDSSQVSLLVFQQIFTAETCSKPEVSKLLEEYADYLVGDICFQLRFEISEIDSMEDCRNAKLPLLLDAVVQHASAKLRPNWLPALTATLDLSSAPSYPAPLENILTYSQLPVL